MEREGEGCKKEREIRERRWERWVMGEGYKRGMREIGDQKGKIEGGREGTEQ